MNAGTNAKNSSSGTVRNVVGVIIFILVCVGLYYLYKFLYGSTASQDSITILDKNIAMTAAKENTALGGTTACAVTSITGIMDGGQYSTSFWVYVSDTKEFSGAGAVGGGKLAHLMEISDNRLTAAAAAGTTPIAKGKTLHFVGLNPTNGSLIVRQSTNDVTSSQIDNSLTSSSGTNAATNYPLSSLIGGYNTSGTTYTSKDSCDILNGIEYQRWVLVTTVANGKTLDVYIDGKLARSCIYKANYMLGSSGGNATSAFGVNNEGKLKGFFSSGKFYNYALTPDAVWALYQAGPGGTLSISDFFSNLFSINVSFQSNINLNPT
jgi:hypothetical protein